MRILLICILFSFQICTYAELPSGGMPSGGGMQPPGQMNGQRSMGGLSAKMDKKTKEALKAFKGLVKNKRNKDADNDFAASIGKDPTSADFEGQTDKDEVTQTQFKFG